MSAANASADVQEVQQLVAEHRALQAAHKDLQVRIWGSGPGMGFRPRALSGQPAPIRAVHGLSIKPAMHLLACRMLADFFARSASKLYALPVAFFSYIEDTPSLVSAPIAPAWPHAPRWSEKAGHWPAFRLLG
jgi:hypothetical protein